MKLYSPAWIIVAGAVVVQASGLFGAVGNGITGLDKAITATIDLKKMFRQAVIEPIQPVILPPAAVKKKVPKQ